MYFSMGEMVGLPLPSYVAGMDGMFNLALTELLLTLPIVIINRKYYINGFKTLLHRAPTMDALIAVGSGAALVYGNLRADSNRARAHAGGSPQLHARPVLLSPQA